MRRSTSTPASIRSSRRSSPARTGRGATSTNASCRSERPMPSDPAPLAPPPRPAEAFPTLDAGQIERVRGAGTERAFHSGEILFDQGDLATRLFVVLEGSIEIVHPNASGEHLITVHAPGSFTGEFDVLTGG